MPSQLANASISASALTATSLNTMAGTADGRAALNYVIGCALPTGVNVTATVGGIPYTFQGSVGLAAGWQSRALTVTEQHWVSSCTLSRLNQNGVVVSISMRGAATQLVSTSEELSSYTIQEGGFFGNIFAGKDYYVAACQGTDASNADRQCAQLGDGINLKTKCGIDYAGMCADVCNTDASPYGGCLGLNGVGYTEVVTTYLQVGG
ncbi:MAG TPA: hypothetical protein VGM88_12060 [Kofleriaceae bacterium]